MGFVLGGTNVVQAITASSAVVTGVKSGQPYLVTSTTDCYLAIGGAAALNAGIFIPAKYPQVLRFGSDLGAANVDLRVIGTTGYIHLNPGKEIGND
jgi:hypothetical protein